jgi:mannose-6-phosphate isomerase class I
MNKPTETIDRILSETKGILKLKPTYVRRYYRDGGRLGLSKRSAKKPKTSAPMWFAERWLASTVTAAVADPIPAEGLSFLDVPGKRISLKEALSIRAEAIVGPELATQYGPQFPVLSKILDPDEPIVFHFHARDEDVRKFPKNFRGHKAGKDEAYYFLPRPKGRVPYIHFGLHPGVTTRDLQRAIEKGSDYALELSPVFEQRFEEGFYVPAGIPHRPGTALTLEIQQPSDVYTMLECASRANKLSPQLIHPGFGSLNEALSLIDLDLCQKPDFAKKCRLVPQLIQETQQAQEGEESWIFPPKMTFKFSGKRLRVTGTFETTEDSAYLLLVWSGTGELDGRLVKPGDEFLVTFSAARARHSLRRTGENILEVFKLFPPRVEDR